VRDERYRYIRYADGSEELYDLVADPREWTNRSGDSAMAGVKIDYGGICPAWMWQPPRAASTACWSTIQPPGERCGRGRRSERGMWCLKAQTKVVPAGPAICRSAKEIISCAKVYDWIFFVTGRRTHANDWILDFI
jgi:hypothetical protein